MSCLLHPDFNPLYVFILFRDYVRLVNGLGFFKWTKKMTPGPSTPVFSCVWRSDDLVQRWLKCVSWWLPITRSVYSTSLLWCNLLAAVVACTKVVSCPDKRPSAHVITMLIIRKVKRGDYTLLHLDAQRSYTSIVFMVSLGSD